MDPKVNGQLQHDWSWLIAVYLFLGGVGGGAYTIAAINSFLGTGLELSTTVGLWIGFPALLIGTLFLLGGIGTVISGPQAGRLSDRIGRKRILLASFFGLSLVMALMPTMTRALWVAYPLFFMAMVLIAMRTGPFGAMLTALVPAWRRGALLSLTVAMGQLGYSLGGALSGPLYSHFGYVGNTLWASLTVLGAGWVIWFRLPEPERTELALKGCSVNEMDGNLSPTVRS